MLAFEMPCSACYRATSCRRTLRCDDVHCLRGLSVFHRGRCTRGRRLAAEMTAAPLTSLTMSDGQLDAVHFPAGWPSVAFLRPPTGQPPASHWPATRLTADPAPQETVEPSQRETELREPRHSRSVTRHEGAQPHTPTLLLARPSQHSSHGKPTHYSSTPLSGSSTTTAQGSSSACGAMECVPAGHTHTFVYLRRLCGSPHVVSTQCDGCGAERSTGCGQA